MRESKDGERDEGAGCTGAGWGGVRQSPAISGYLGYRTEIAPDLWERCDSSGLSHPIWLWESGLCRPWRSGRWLCGLREHQGLWVMPTLDAHVAIARYVSIKGRLCVMAGSRVGLVRVGRVPPSVPQQEHCPGYRHVSSGSIGALSDSLGGFGSPPLPGESAPEPGTSGPQSSPPLPGTRGRRRLSWQRAGAGYASAPWRDAAELP